MMDIYPENGPRLIRRCKGKVAPGPVLSGKDYDADDQIVTTRYQKGVAATFHIRHTLKVAFRHRALSWRNIAPGFGGSFSIELNWTPPPPPRSLKKIKNNPHTDWRVWRNLDCRNVALEELSDY